MNWQKKCMKSWRENWVYSNNRRQEVPHCALYGCTDIYTIDVAYFAHCGICFFEIKFKFTSLQETYFF